MKWASSRHGFTIVELLIVVVVVAILAAITIVAYNGIQNRTKASVAQSAAAQVSKKVAAYAVENADMYPLDKTVFLNYAGLTDGSGIDAASSYQYTVSTDRKSYCLTTTTRSISYFTTNANQSPQVGACPGHGANGVVPITNLVTNPSFETNLSGWSVSTLTASQTTTTSASGNASAMVQHTGAALDGYFQALQTAASAAKTYTGSALLRKSGTTTSVAPWLIFRDASGTVISTVSGGSATLNPSASWTRRFVTATAPANTAFVSFWVGVGIPPTSDVFYVDSVMLTEGNKVYDYVDPATSPTSWVWNGAVNGSTSTGPPIN